MVVNRAVRVRQAPDRTDWGRRLALRDGVYADSAGAVINGTWDLDPADPLYGTSTQEYGWSQRNTAPVGDPEVWQDTPVLRTDGSYTVSVWGRVGATDTYQAFVSQDSAQNSGFLLYFAPESGGRYKVKVHAAPDVSPSPSYAVGAASNATGWHHLVAVLDAGFLWLW